MTDWKEYGVGGELAALDAEVMELCGRRFSEIDEVRDFNQLKVLDAFRECRVSAAHLLGSTGYGYGDIGRDKLDQLSACIFSAEDSLCRTQFMSGTHAITVALFGVLRSGMTLFSATGTPYDTIRAALGQREGNGSLLQFGVGYRQAELRENNPDYDAIEQGSRDADAVYIQRSRGYSPRRAMTLSDIEKIAAAARRANPDILVIVDNCYGEFTQKTEPTRHGADLIIGSMIKNPGGGIAETGGYIAGRGDLIRQCAERLTAPGVGREIGCNPLGYRSMFLGLYMAPQITAEALKSAVYAGVLFEKLGYPTDPGIGAERNDIITTVRLGTAEKLELFCRAVQAGSPVDSFAVPEGDDMPGYDSKVIMASGSFTNGSSIELSADAPLREPYTAYVQGGLNLITSRRAFLKAAEALLKG